MNEKYPDQTEQVKIMMNQIDLNIKTGENIFNSHK